ncbi:MAG: hypothetical protein ACRETY_14725, partial [Steroidobacteraceae bacterium]
MRFTTTGSGSERVRVEEGEEHYIVNWHTKRFALTEGLTYRIRVLVAGAELGHRDVKVADNGAGDGGGSGAVTVIHNGRTLPIKFWIEKPPKLLVVMHDPGVTGTPANEDAIYRHGATVSYS